MAGGSLVEAIGGLGGLVLGIVALAGVDPRVIISIGVLAIGAAFLAQGGTLAGRYADLAGEVSNTNESEDVGTGVTVELLGGAAGVALGILALLGVEPMRLLAVVTIAFGATMLLGGNATARLNDLRFAANPGTNDRARAIAREAVAAATGAQALVGLASVTLGILALLNIATMTLVSVAVLAVGASVLLTGSALGARLMALVRH